MLKKNFGYKYILHLFRTINAFQEITRNSIQEPMNTKPNIPCTIYFYAVYVDVMLLNYTANGA
jgi:hypothetical protein